MERKLQERMIGATVLVIALVIIGPLVLDGGPQRDLDTDAIPGQRSDELHTHTFDLRAPAATAAAAVTATPAPAVAPAAGPAQAAAPPVEAGPAEPGGMPTEAPVVEPPPPVVKPSPTKVAAAEPPVAAAAAPSTPRPEAGGTWLVQVGTFSQKRNADKLVATLKARGFAASLSTSASGGRTLHRVRVGPAGSRESATALAGRLAAAGHPGQPVAQ